MPIIRRGTPFTSSAVMLRPRRGLRGLGQEVIDPESGLPMSQVSASTGGSSGSGISTAIFQNLPSIIKGGFQTLQLALTPTGSYLVQGPGGTYTIANQVPGAVPGQFNLGTSSFSTGSNWMILLLGGIAVFVIAKSVGGGR